MIERPALADALANGAIDFYEVGAGIDLFQRAKGIPGVVLRDAVTPDYNHLTFNGAKSAVLADPGLRTAIMRGVDTQVIARALPGRITNGEVRPVGNRMFLPGNKNYRDNSAITPFSQDAAKSELDALGWKLDGEYRVKDGRQLAPRYVVPSPNAPGEQVAKLVQSQLEQIGVKVDINAVPSAEFLTKWVFTGNFDVMGSAGARACSRSGWRSRSSPSTRTPPARTTAASATTRSTGCSSRPPPSWTTTSGPRWPTGSTRSCGRSGISCRSTTSPVRSRSGRPSRTSVPGGYGQYEYENIGFTG